MDSHRFYIDRDICILIDANLIDEINVDTFDKFDEACYQILRRTVDRLGYDIPDNVIRNFEYEMYPVNRPEENL